MSISRLAAACVLSFVSASSMAGSYSFAQVGDLTFTLIDLDPTDGITPSYNLLTLQSGNRSSVSATANDATQGWSESASRSRDLSFFPLDVDANAGSASAQAHVRTDAVSAGGVANGSGTSYNAAASTGSTNGYYYYGGYGIELSARSVLIVSASATAQAWAGNAACSGGTYYYGYCGTESASAAASLNLSYSYASGSTSTNYSFSDQVSASASASGGYTYQYDPYYGYRTVMQPGADQGQFNSRTLTAVFTNSSAMSQFASLGLSASVQGAATTMVPEPSTLALHGLGLAGMAGVMFRRRVRARLA